MTIVVFSHSIILIGITTSELFSKLLREVKFPLILDDCFQICISLVPASLYDSATNQVSDGGILPAGEEFINHVRVGRSYVN